MNDLNKNFTAQLLEEMGEQSFDGIPEFPEDMHPWDIILAVRHLLPSNDREIIALVENQDNNAISA
jgi:hypothetical protein